MASVDLAQLLEVCVRATLAAQHYVMLDLIRLPELEANMSHRKSSSDASPPLSVLDLPLEDRELLLASLRGAVNVDVKSHLDYKEGDAAEDLVTTADVLTQAVLTQALGAAFPDSPFTIVGEEEEPSSAIAAEAAACMSKHYEGHSSTPFAEELRSHLHSHARSGTNSTGVVSVVQDTSAAALRRRVGVFIDPIDGTNCFFGGVWQAPMTLVGISLDGLPVAAVMNRVFYYPLSAPADTTRGGPSLSVVFSTPGLSSPFVVFDGAPLPAPVAAAPHPPCTGSASLVVCRSSTTKEEFLESTLRQLQPCESVCARGAGYKQYYLLKSMWAGTRVASEHITPADVFVCPPVTIKKWDCCAPHAFLYAMGGEIFSHQGVPLRYPLVRDDGTAGTHLELAALPDGLLAVTPYVKAEVARRMGWPASQT